MGKKIIPQVIKKANEKKRDNLGLCFRCEHRARFLETSETTIKKGQVVLYNGCRPKFECGEIEFNRYGCYMYKPVKPIVTQKNKGDKRPQFAGWGFSARSHFVRIPTELEMGLALGRVKGGWILYYRPRTKEEKKEYKEKFREQRKWFNNFKKALRGKK